MAAATARRRISGDGGGATFSTSAVVLEQAGRLAVGAAGDLASRHVGGAARHAGSFQGGAVGEVHVPIEAVDPHRVVRRHPVDPVLRRQLAAPQGVVPVASRYPRAFRHLRGKRLDPADELVAGPGVAKLHGREAQAALEKMNVGVDESR